MKARWHIFQNEGFHLVMVVLWVLPTWGYGQSLTLEEPIEKGLANRSEIKNAQLEIELAQRQNDRLKAQYLPQINGTADLRWNT